MSGPVSHPLSLKPLMFETCVGMMAMRLFDPRLRHAMLTALPAMGGVSVAQVIVGTFGDLRRSPIMTSLSA